MNHPPPRPLFRLEAMQFRHARMAAGTTLRPPVSLAVLSVALTLSVLAIGTYLGTQSYARKAAAPGYLAPKHGVVRVLPPRAGVITAVSVADGDFVQAGDKLFEVDIGRRAPGGVDVDATVHQALLAQRDLQQQQLTQQAATAQSEHNRLSERISQLQEETQALALQLSVQHDRANLATEQAEVSRALAAQGFVSAVEQRRREDTRLAQAQTLQTLRQQLAAKAGDLVELRYALAQLPGRTAERQASLRAAIAELDTRLADADGQRAYLVVAPAAGRVSALQASVGNPADPAQPLLSIVPEGDELQAILLVPERAIGFVAPGQAVRLAFDAFPFQRFGAQTGTITTIARTLLRPEQLSGAVQPPREPSYRVTVTLAGQSLMAYGQRIPLQADMQLSASIIFDRRSFIAWLFDPLISARDRS